MSWVTRLCGYHTYKLRFLLKDGVYSFSELSESTKILITREATTDKSCLIFFDHGKEKQIATVNFGDTPTIEILGSGISANLRDWLRPTADKKYDPISPNPEFCI